MTPRPAFNSAVIVFAWMSLWFGLAANAQAHRIPEADAESRWYYVFKGQCDVGGDCSIRKSFLDCDPEPGRPHAYWCDYEYRQQRASFPFGVDYRWCHITGILVHTTVDESHKNCTGWS